MNVTRRSLVSNVDDAQVRQVGLRDRFVYGFVLFDSPDEVLLRGFGRRIFIVRIPGAYFEGDIRGNDGGVVAYRLEEDHGHALLFQDAGFDLRPARTSAIRCV